MSGWHRYRAQTLFYPTLWWNMFLGRRLKLRRWWDYIDDRVIVGAFPFAKDVPGLADEGVRAVVNTCEEYGGPVDAYKLAGIEQLHIPTTDFTPPRLQDIEKAVEFVEQHVDRDQTVYIHCKAGRARSATVAMCYLIKKHGWTPEQAQRRLLERRPHIHATLDRRQVVLDFYKKVVEHRPESTLPTATDAPPQVTVTPAAPTIPGVPTGTPVAADGTPAPPVVPETDRTAAADVDAELRSASS